MHGLYSQIWGMEKANVNSCIIGNYMMIIQGFVECITLTVQDQMEKEMDSQMETGMLYGLNSWYPP